MPIDLDYPSDLARRPYHEPDVRIASINGDLVYCYDEPEGHLQVSMSQDDIDALEYENGGLPIAWLWLAQVDAPAFSGVKRISSVATRAGGFLLSRDAFDPSPLPPIQPVATRQWDSGEYRRVIMLLALIVVMLLALMGALKWPEHASATALRFAYCQGEPYGPGLLTAGPAPVWCPASPYSRR